MKNKLRAEWIRMSIAVLIGGFFSLITVNLIGSGHALIETLGSLAHEETPTIFGLPIIYTLALVLIMRAKSPLSFVSTYTI